MDMTPNSKNNFLNQVKKQNELQKYLHATYSHGQDVLD